MFAFFLGSPGVAIYKLEGLWVDYSHSPERGHPMRAFVRVTFRYRWRNSLKGRHAVWMWLHWNLKNVPREHQQLNSTFISKSNTPYPPCNGKLRIVPIGDSYEMFGLGGPILGHQGTWRRRYHKYRIIFETTRPLEPPLHLQSTSSTVTLTLRLG